MATIAIKSTTIVMATMVNSFWQLDYRTMRYCYLINWSTTADWPNSDSVSTSYHCLDHFKVTDFSL